MAQLPTPFVSYRTFAERELASEEKHEWHDGIVVAMAGGTPRHGALTMRVGAALTAALAGRPCQVFSSDVKIRSVATRLGTYPDVSVVRGDLQVDDDDPNSILNPILVVEVLSDSTEAYDRGAKFANYRAIPSMRAVLLVNHRADKLELFAAGAESWALIEAAPSDVLRIEALDVSIAVAEIYREPLPR